MTSTNEKPNPFACLMTRQEFCDAYGILYRTAEMMAHKGQGPRVTKLGRKAYYHVDDITAWIESQRAKSAERFAGAAA
ncbi:helix-turn-helix transcriptional regulator [Luteimonas sp. WGS1318]|uniref:helix-turn-helix transcriptional regulator n=1 Tax=Luteimonas sp. WGS1318 TaxID=3366815 RepID=UPI00372CF0E7